jgi:hypothetical protein
LPGNHMLTLPLNRCSPGDELFLRESLCRGEADQTLLAVGERTGLVKDDDIETACSLKCQASAYEDAVACRECRRDGDHQRNGESERVGVGSGNHNM